MPLQKLAQAAASAALWETKYEFSSYSAIKKEVDEFNTIAMLCVRTGRVCGSLVSRERECAHTAALDSFQENHQSWRPTEVVRVQAHRRRALEMIWVLKKKRRQGVAKGLIEALAKYCGLGVEDFAHMVPFTEDALELRKVLGLSNVYVV
jgi:ribosomal protein S18 acetylase RimI-like enzyme